MSPLRSLLLTTFCVALISFAAGSADALTMQECSAKYKAEKTAGTLKGRSWNQFRKEECSAAAPASEKGPSPKSEAAAPSGGNAVFPNSVSPSYAKESAGKARMHTCLDQYKANKATGGNGGLKWIQKGGGYYSECNKRLKG
jgi:hypothetical protein